MRFEQRELDDEQESIHREQAADCLARRLPVSVHGRIFAVGACVRALRARTTRRDGGRLGPPTGRRGLRHGHGSCGSTRAGSIANSGGFGSARIAHQTTTHR